MGKNTYKLDAKARKRLDLNFYRKLGRAGGAANNAAKGFGSEKMGADGLTGRERSKKWASIAGSKSRRGPAKKYMDIKGKA